MDAFTLTSVAGSQGISGATGDTVTGFVKQGTQTQICWGISFFSNDYMVVIYYSCIGDFVLKYLYDFDWRV